jgi:hypothetical protein
MSTPQIETYRFGCIVIDGQVYAQDVIILPDRVLGGWWRKEGHALGPDDLEAVLDAAPELLVVGQGAHGRMRVTPEACQVLRGAGIELIVQATREACQTYESLRAQRSVAAALHLTC